MSFTTLHNMSAQCIVQSKSTLTTPTRTTAMRDHHQTSPATRAHVDNTMWWRPLYP